MDLLKGDCYYGTRDATPNDAELEMFADSIAESQNPVVISLSPGVNVTTPEASDIHAKVSMYRISDDLHDCWNNSTKCDCGDHIAVSQQFGALPVNVHGSHSVRGSLLFSSSVPQCALCATLDSLTHASRCNLQLQRESALIPRLTSSGLVATSGRAGPIWTSHPSGL